MKKIRIPRKMKKRIMKANYVKTIFKKHRHPIIAITLSAGRAAITMMKLSQQIERLRNKQMKAA